MLKKGMDKARPRPVVVRYNEGSTAVQEHVTAAVTGGKSVDQAAGDLQNASTALTAQS